MNPMPDPHAAGPPVPGVRPLDPPPPPSPGAPPNLAPPSGGLDRATAEARIAAIRADLSHPFHRGAPAELAEMTRLYEVVHGTAAAPSGASVAPNLDYTIALPPGRTPEDFSPVEQAIATAACHAFNLSESEANPVVAWILDARHPKPAVAEGRATLTRETAAERLQQHWGAHWPKQMAYARAALTVLDSRRGGRPGELREEFERTGAGNAPGVIMEFAKLGAALARDPEAQRLIAEYEPEYAEEYAQRRRAGRRP